MIKTLVIAVALLAPSFVSSTPIAEASSTSFGATFVPSVQDCDTTEQYTVPAGTVLEGSGDTAAEATVNALITASGVTCPHEICGWADCMSSGKIVGGTILTPVWARNPGGWWDFTGTVGAGGVTIDITCACP